MDIEKDELPQGWAWATVADVVDTIRPKVSPTSDSALPFLGLEHLEAHGLTPSGKGNFSEMKSSAASFKPGDVLYGRLRPYLNKVWCADYAGACSAEFIVMTPPEGVSGKFIRYLLHAQSFVSFASHTTSGDRPHADFDDLKIFEFALPPSREQDRIADKIDELFSDIDEGERGLRTVQALLKKHRQAVMKAAVTGELTRDWRDRHGSPTETGAALLTCILAARRATWEADQHAKAKAAGKVLKGEAWKAKYEEPRAAEAIEDLEIPSRWAWGSLEQCSTLVTSGSRGWKDYYSDVGALFVRAQDIKYDRLELGDVAYVALPPKCEGLRTRILQNDLLITITGANVSKAAMVTTELSEAYVNQHVALVRLAVPHIGKYLHLWTIAEQGGRKVLLRAAYGAGKAGPQLGECERPSSALASARRDGRHHRPRRGGNVQDRRHGGGGRRRAETLRPPAPVHPQSRLHRQAGPPEPHRRTCKCPACPIAGTACRWHSVEAGFDVPAAAVASATTAKERGIELSIPPAATGAPHPR